MKCNMKDKCRGLQSHIFGGLSLVTAKWEDRLTNGIKIAKC